MTFEVIQAIFIERIDTMKLLRIINNDIKVYDCNIRDYFGGKVEVWYNETMDSYKLMSKYKDYKKRRKYLDSIGCKHVIIQEYGEVIDITEATLRKLNNLFGHVKYRPHFEPWEY